jgi:hypothetical protein
MERAAKAIRIATLAPILAGAMLIDLQIVQPEVFPHWGYFVYTFFFLAVLPVLAYPVQKVLPRFSEKGREGQRHLAMIFAFCGYVLDVVVNRIADAPNGLLYIGLLYLISGALVLASNQLLHLRASGHAAGVTAAALVLITLKETCGVFIGISILILVYLSSIRIKRHTFAQLLGGTLIPIAVSIPLSSILSLC